MLSVVPSNRLILGSASPRRKELLAGVGLSFEVVVSAVDETPRATESAQEMVERLARAKAQAVAQRHPAAWVLGADTTVLIDGQVLGKPESPAQAVSMLQRIQGRTHEVWGAFALCCVDRGVCSVEIYGSEVTMVAIPPECIAAYVATGEPLDKAGSYAVQGIGAAFIESVKGSYTNVVGLNLAAVVQQLFRHRVVELR